MQIILLSFLGLTLLVFCVVDLYHLKQILKTLRSIEYYISNMEEFERIKLNNWK